MSKFVGDSIQIKVRHEYGQSVDGAKASPYTEAEKLHRQSLIEKTRLGFRCPSCNELAGRIGRDAVNRVWLNGGPPDGWKDPTGATPSCCGVKFPIHILHDWQEANGISKW